MTTNAICFESNSTATALAQIIADFSNETCTPIIDAIVAVLEAVEVHTAYVAADPFASKFLTSYECPRAAAISLLADDAVEGVYVASIIRAAAAECGN